MSESIIVHGGKCGFALSDAERRKNGRRQPLELPSRIALILAGSHAFRFRRRAGRRERGLADAPPGSATPWDIGREGTSAIDAVHELALICAVMLFACPSVFQPAKANDRCHAVGRGVSRELLPTLPLLNPSRRTSVFRTVIRGANAATSRIAYA